MSESKHGAFRRKRYLIDPGFQLKYAFLFFALGLTAAGAVGTVAFFFFKRTYQDFLNAYYYQSPQLVAGLEGQLRGLTLWMVFLFALLAIFCLVFGILLTHRVVGPIHKLRKAMDEVAAGRSDVRLHLRSNDEFQDLAESFNRMLDSRQKQ